MSEFKRYVALIEGLEVALAVLAGGARLDADKRLAGAVDIAAKCGAGAGASGLAAKSAGFERRLTATDEVTEPAYLQRVSDARLAADAADAAAAGGPESLGEHARALRAQLRDLEQAPVVVLVPRYGAAMREQVVAGLARFKRLAADAAELVEALEVEAAHLEEDRLVEMSTEAARKAQEMEVAATEAYAAAQAADAAKRALVDVSAAKERDDAARFCTAEVQRKERAARREAILRAQSEAIRLEAQEAKLHGRGVGAVETALETLRNADYGADYATALCNVERLLGTICEKPDDSQLRTIRVANARFAEAMGRFAGVREVLIAAGFDLVHRESPVPMPADVDDDFCCFEAFLICHEPEPLIDTEEWSNWFNNLRACHARVKEEAQKLSPPRRDILKI
ncbi:hypothetical protein M885DRAFT_537564 [Pelagophyceae sp. CCMP2097]|nr:hypothetical protein M885DRAFT_537564 [Pelagophyceae sp. CCMP2097]